MSRIDLISPWREGGGREEGGREGGREGERGRGGGGEGRGRKLCSWFLVRFTGFGY